jgi:alkylation response protein AidB-like acyl-CoA dehydrogenase
METTPATSEQAELELVRHTAQRLFVDRQGQDSSLRTFAEVGLLGLLVPMEAGGAGWYPREASVVLEEAGRMGDAAPIIGALVGTALLARAVTSEASSRWLGSALAGIDPVLFARGMVESTPLAEGTHHVQGEVGPVIGADQAAALIVKTSGSNSGVYAVAMRQPGVVVSPAAQILDTRREATMISIAGAKAERLDLSPEDPAVASLISIASILACSDSLGAFRLARARLTEYLQDRLAFGAPIASFQAVQHRLVDLYILEQRMEAAIGAAVREITGLTPATSKAVAVAVAYVGSNCRQALDECVQLSGGLGFVWEYPLHHEMRRAALNGVMFDSPRDARARLARLDGW